MIPQYVEEPEAEPEPPSWWARHFGPHAPLEMWWAVIVGAICGAVACRNPGLVMTGVHWAFAPIHF